MVNEQHGLARATGLTRIPHSFNHIHSWHTITRVRWKPKAIDDSAVGPLAKAAGVTALTARLLMARSIRTPEEVAEFLAPSLERLHSPYEMLGMAAAVERLERAIARKENILIYGDYDVDGTTAVVVLKTCIELLGGRADFHVPHRIREGYGMRDDVIEKAAAGGISLVISVDTGIRAFQAAETARQLGLDLIVTDHHLPEAPTRGHAGVPHALAVLNPNQEGCGYPCKALCGAGVAFKLAQALLTRANRESLIPSFLKIVAIATIADSVPLTGENRVIAKLGLDGLRRPVNGGLKALMKVAQLESAGRSLTPTDVSFRLAPRINAAGRMDVARDVVELFTTRDTGRQMEIALKLDSLNTDRQQEERRIVDDIHLRLDSDAALSASYLLVIDGDGWHRGVIGITATRVVERTGKPALVISRDGEESHGSGRSISGFHLLEAIESADCRGLFTRFGGHAHAVGFALPSTNVEKLRAALNAYARERLTEADLVPMLEIDASITLDEVTSALVDEIARLEPFGVGNREPVFRASGARLAQPPRVLKEKHLKLRVMQQGRAFDALAWRMAERCAASPLLAGDLLDIAFSIEQNSNADFGGLQLNVRDFRRAAAAIAEE